MDQETKTLMESLLVAQVLTLAKAISAEKALKGSVSTSGYVPEAVALIAQQRAGILQRLAESQVS
jgi:hypothetical protein